MTVDINQRKCWSLQVCLLLVAVTALGQTSTTTALSASTTTPNFGQNVTFTATVTGSSPTGTVTFVANTYFTIGTCTLSSGSCQFSISNLIPSEDVLPAQPFQQSITAQYAGNLHNLSSTSPPVSVQVGSRPLIPTTTTLGSSLSNSGSRVLLTATVSPQSQPLPGYATGLVTFKNGATVLGTAPIQAASGSGIASSLFGLDSSNSYYAPPVQFWTNRSLANDFHIHWTDINPANGVYNWSDMDLWVNSNVAAGRDMVYALYGTPRWAALYNTQGKLDGAGACSPPSNLTYWDSFLTAVATRYPQIKYYELWNEPNDPGEWCGASPGAQAPISILAAMSQHASTIIKGINLEAVILSPPTNCWHSQCIDFNPGTLNGSGWITTFIQDGGVFDIFGFHGYMSGYPAVSGAVEDIINIVANIQSVESAANISKPIWDTEAGWYTDPTPVLATARQPGFLAKAFILRQSLGLERLLWYEYKDAPQWGQMYNNATGDNANVTAYNSVYSWLVGATLSAPCAVNASFYTCNYTRPHGYQAQAVWQTNSAGSTYTYTYPAGMAQYLDVGGNVHPLVGGTVQIGDAPILLENGNIPAPSATFSTTALPAGTNSITAIYNGDIYDATSTSSPLTVTISSGLPPPSNLQISVQ